MHIKYILFFSDIKVKESYVKDTFKDYAKSVTKMGKRRFEKFELPVYSIDFETDHTKLHQKLEKLIETLEKQEVIVKTIKRELSF